MRAPADLRARAQRIGTDRFGNFHITGGPCTHCGYPSLCIHYRFQTNGQALNLPESVKPSDTIIQPQGAKIDDTYLGINCGCYAKFHRQVTHIEERMKQRAK